MAKQRKNGVVVYISKDGTYKGMPDDTDTTVPDADIDTAVGDMLIEESEEEETYEEMAADDWAMANAMESNYTSDQFKTQSKYIAQSSAWDTGGDGQHSFSQVLNHMLNTDVPLKTVQQKKTFVNLQKMAQPITKNLAMIRAAHADVLQRLGIPDYTKMSQAQLQSELVGLHYHEKAFQSMSWNESQNPFIHGAPAGGREVFIKINAPKGMKVAVGDKHEAEFIGMPGQGYTINKVYFDGSYAFPASTMKATPRIVIEVTADK